MGDSDRYGDNAATTGILIDAGIALKRANIRRRQPAKSESEIDALLLRQISALLDKQHQAWALVGGLAVSVRTEPRFTRDLDLAVAVADDRAAEDLVHRL